MILNEKCIRGEKWFQINYVFGVGNDIKLIMPSEKENDIKWIIPSGREMISVNAEEKML